MTSPDLSDPPTRRARPTGCLPRESTDTGPQGLKIDFLPDPSSNDFTMRIGPNPVGTVSALIALAGITTPLNSPAAIVISSVSNLEIAPGEPTSVDFDGNGTPEFRFFYANTQVIVESIDTTSATKYDEGDGSLRHYPAGTSIELSQPTTTFTGAQIPLASAFYAGFQFEIDGQTHLGWFQLDHVEGDLAVVRIIDAAWQSTAGASLNAGAVPELPTTPLVFGTVAGLAVWWLRRPSRSGHGIA